MEFELAYNNVAVKHVSHSTTETVPGENGRYIWISSLCGQLFKENDNF